MMRRRYAAAMLLAASLLGGAAAAARAAGSRETPRDPHVHQVAGSTSNAYTTIAVRKGAVLTRSAVDAVSVRTGETATIRQGRIHQGGRSNAARPRRTWLAVLQGSVTARPLAPAAWKPLAVAAGQEVVFGESEPARNVLDAARARYARALARGFLQGRGLDRLPAAVRVALVRLNALAAERLREKDMAGLRGLAVADCRVGARTLQELIAEVDGIAAMTRSVDVSYRVSSWRSEGSNGAGARYAATVRLVPKIVPDLHAEISLAGSVRYRRRAGTWRFDNFGIDHAAVDSKRLPAAFDRLNDLLVPE